jgi:hypothetical protein
MKRLLLATTILVGTMSVAHANCSALASLAAQESALVNRINNMKCSPEQSALRRQLIAIKRQMEARGPANNCRITSHKEEVETNLSNCEAALAKQKGQLKALKAAEDALKEVHKHDQD